MARIEPRLGEMGLVLPAPLQTPAGRLPFNTAVEIEAEVEIDSWGRQAVKSRAS